MHYLGTWLKIWIFLKVRECKVQSELSIFSFITQTNAPRNNVKCHLDATW